MKTFDDVTAEHKADLAKRRAVHVLPKGKRPYCRFCGKELRLYRNRREGSPRLYGDYGDGFFCGLKCGHAYAVLNS